MVATTDCGEKSKPITGHKVSKPLMEKKRRARINKCLDQLKYLLETYYSSNIRKRKLEKADILELTVKHLRNLQKIQSCAAAASEFSEYQTGFRSCLANVNQYLVMADTLNGGDRWLLSQLSSKLCGSAGRAGGSSTMDSGPGQAEIQDEARALPPSAAGPEERNTAGLKAPKPHSSKPQSPKPQSPKPHSSKPQSPKPQSPKPQSPKPQSASAARLAPSEDARPSSGARQAVAAAAPSLHSHDKSPGHKKCRSVGHGNEAANCPRSVWRPW